MAQDTWHNTTDSIYAALDKAYRRKTSRQRKKREVAEAYAHSDEFCRGIEQELLGGDYVIGDYRHFVLRDAKKDRDISVLPFKDRVVQNAIKEAIEPILLNQMTDDMLGGLPNRGVLVKHKTFGVVRRMQRIMNNENYKYYIQGDIAKFYDNVDNVFVMCIIEQLIHDERTLALIRQHLFKQKKLAIGDPFSHLMANLLMSRIVRTLKGAFPDVEIVNFADDIFIAATSKERLKEVRKAMAATAKEYRLHYKKSLYIRPLDTCQPITFCGFRYTRNAVLLTRRIKLRYIKSRHKKRSMASYNGILSMADTKHLRFLVERLDNKYMQKIRRPYAGENIKIANLVGIPHSIIKYEEKPSRQKVGDTYMHVQALTDNGLIVYTTSSPKMKQYLKENTPPLRDVKIIHDWSGFYYEGTVYTDEEEEAMLREQFNIPKKTTT